VPEGIGAQADRRREGIKKEGVDMAKFDRSRS